MTFDWNVSIADLLTIIGAIITFIYFINRLGSRLDIVEHDLSGINQTLTKMTEYLRLADQLNGRMEEFEHRLDAISRRLDHHLEGGHNASSGR